MATEPQGTDTGSSIYDSGASNLDILESVGNSLIDESSAASSSGSSDTAAPPTDATGASVNDGVADVAVRPEWFETAPAEFKAIMEHANISREHKAWLEKEYGELHGFRSSPFGAKESVDELAELFPGGIEDIRVAAEQSQNFAREMEQFRSGDPAQQSELLANLLQDPGGPEPFISLTANAIELLKETLPRDYTAMASGITQGHLNEVTDGKFATFFDTVRGVASEYQAKIDSGDADGAAKLASRLGGYALQMADWWGTAKNKLGFGEKTEGSNASTQGQLPRPSINTSRGVDPNDKDVIYAQRDANYFTSNLLMKHDSFVQPLVVQSLNRELAARKLEVPPSWKKDVLNFVESGIKNALATDKQYTALENRVYKRGAGNDPRRWDNSEKVSNVLLNYAKQKAQQVAPVLLKQALDRLMELKGGAKPAAQPGAGQRGGKPSTAATGAPGNWEDELKAGKISGAEAVQRIAGIN